MSSKIARPGSEGNMRLLKQYGGGSTPPRQHYASGGAVKGENPSLAEGLSAAGGPSKMGAGKKSGKAKKEAKTNVNVVIMPKGDDAKPPMPPMPMPPGAAAGMPPPPMPPGPPMPPPGAGPGGPPPPMMRKAGGRVMKHDDAAADKSMVAKGVHKHEANMHPGKPKTKLATGGPAKEPTTKGLVAENGFQGGGGGGVGRLEKMKKYGK